MNKQFTPEQEEELMDARYEIEDDITVALIANPKFTPRQMYDLKICALSSNPLPASNPYDLTEREQALAMQTVRMAVLEQAIRYLEENRVKPASLREIKHSLHAGR